MWGSLLLSVSVLIPEIDNDQKAICSPIVIRCRKVQSKACKITVVTRSDSLLLSFSVMIPAIGNGQEPIWSKIGIRRLKRLNSKLVKSH